MSLVSTQGYYVDNVLWDLSMQPTAMLESIYTKGDDAFFSFRISVSIAIKGNFHVQSYQCFSIDPHSRILR